MSTADPPSPRALYEQKLRIANQQHQRASRAHDWLGWTRVIVFLVVVGALYQACDRRTPPGFALAGSLLLFVAVSIALARAGRQRDDAHERQAYYGAGLARLDGRWAEGAPDGREFADEAHPYAADLDLFGPHSLFALLSQARTSPGEETLANWLKSGAAAADVPARQEAVRELAARGDLRERLWRVAGAVGRDGGAGKPDKAETLSTWVRKGHMPSTGARVAAAGLGAAGLGALAILMFGPPGVAIGIFAVEFFVSRRWQPTVALVEAGAQRRADELKAVAALMTIVEQERFTATGLLELQRALSSQDRLASRRVAELSRLVDWFESRKNPFFGIITAPLLLVTQFAFAIEAWRARHGEAVTRWIAAIGELEALASLATFAFEHPALPFPQILPDADGPRFEARGLGHPLIPPDRRIANDVALSPQTRLLLVTGSNMSGKSTFLRTIGVNTVLALCGAPVCAAELRVSRLAIGATLRANDSLDAGVSRFFAEIKRLSVVVAMAEKDAHTLYLLDEILHGTNSKDRLAGATAIVRTLVARGAIGLITTHDLALARIVEEVGGVAANVHFQDTIEADRLNFDYRLRPGIVTRSNALALMKLVGLPVDDAPSAGRP